MTEKSNHPLCLHVTAYFGGTMCKCVECLKYRNTTHTETPHFQMDRGLTVMRFELGCFELLQSTVYSPQSMLVLWTADLYYAVI